MSDKKKDILCNTEIIEAKQKVFDFMDTVLNKIPDKTILNECQKKNNTNIIKHKTSEKNNEEIRNKLNSLEEANISKELIKNNLHKNDF